jgi:hypothetical protein
MEAPHAKPVKKRRRWLIAAFVLVFILRMFQWQIA